MTMPHVLDRLFESAVVVTPGDRPEVVLGVLMAHLSANFPQVSAIVLNGGIALPEQVTRLLEGTGASLPIIATELGTHEAATAADVGARPADLGLAAQGGHGPDPLRPARRRRRPPRPARRGRTRRS